MRVKLVPPEEFLYLKIGGHELGRVYPVKNNRKQVRLEWNDSVVESPVRLTESFAMLPGVVPEVSRVSTFFGGYLPEGAQRRAMAQQRHIAEDDLFSFLKEYGGSLAGALSFSAEKKDVGYTKLTNAELSRVLKDSVGKLNQGTRDDSRSMIPGFQPKVLVTKFDDSSWFFPIGDGHSTHILKPARPKNPERIVDEFYALRLAQNMGLLSYQSELLDIGTSKVLSIERFDRKVVDSNVQVMHQEDSAQAMGLDWFDDQRKFQDRANPNDKRNASAYKIAEVVSGLDDEPLEKWLQQLLFRVLIGDNDGHAKNVGIMHFEDFDCLSDIYDAVPNLFQEDRITWDLALAIDGEFDHRKITVDHLLSEAQAWGMSEKLSEKVVAETFNSFSTALSVVDFPSGGSPMVQEAVSGNLVRLEKGLEIGSAHKRKV